MSNFLKLLSLISILVFSNPGLSAAQFKDLPEDLGKMRVGGIDVSLWRSQTGKQLYYIPYIGMDWAFFAGNNAEIENNDLSLYCQNQELTRENKLWKIKINTDDEKLRHDIVNTWNSSDRPSLYADFFNKGKVSLESIQIAPMVGFSIFLDLPINGNIGLAEEQFVLNGTAAYDGTIPVPFIRPAQLTPQQVCEWWDWRSSDVLKGFILIEALQYNNTILSRTASQTVERSVLKSLEVGGSRSLPVPPMSEGQILALEQTSLGIISTAAAAAAGGSGGTASPVAAISALLASGAVKIYSGRWKEKIRRYENSEIIVTSLSDETISSIVQSFSDSIIVQIGDEKTESFVSEWMQATQQRLTTLIANNTFTLSMQTEANLAEFRDQTGEVVLDVQAEGLPSGLKGDLVFQLIDKSSLTNEIRSRAEFFTATGTSSKPVAMATIDGLSFRAKDWLDDTLEAFLDAEFAQITQQSDDAFDIERKRYADLRESLSRLGEQVEQALVNAEIQSQKGLSEYSEAVAIVSEAARSLTPSFNVPMGTIIWWNPTFTGQPVPDGWAVADGSKVTLSTGETLFTPDLLGKGIIGGQDSIGEVVGSNTVMIDDKSGATSLTVAQMPRHSHTIRHNGRLNAGIESKLIWPRDTVDVRLPRNNPPHREMETEYAGSGRPHDHKIQFSFDNRAESVVLIPLMKL